MSADRGFIGGLASLVYRQLHKLHKNVRKALKCKFRVKIFIGREDLGSS